jgi:predicted ATP-grasp superfamily ATP-dependent carboligase
MIPRRPLRSTALASFTLLEACNDDPGRFERDLLAIIERNRIDTIIPCGDEVLVALVPISGKLKDRVTLCCPPPETCRQVLSKHETLRIAAKLGIPFPRIHQLGGRQDLAARQAEIEFPVVAKPRCKEYGILTGINLCRFDSFAELAAAFDRDPSFGQTFLIQEYLPGVGVGVEAVMHRGQPAVLFQHRRVREFPVDGGVSVAAVSEPLDPVLSGHAVRLLRALNWEGAAMVEFRQDPASGRVGLMEVNGRFWGSMALSCRAGLEFPYYSWQVAHGIAPEPPPRYKIVRFRWLHGDIQRMLHIVRMLRRGQIRLSRAARDAVVFFRDFLAPGRDAIWAWSDPRPALDELLDLANQIAGVAATGAAKILHPKRPAGC